MGRMKRGIGSREAPFNALGSKRSGEAAVPFRLSAVFAFFFGAALAAALADFFAAAAVFFVVAFGVFLAADAPPLAASRSAFAFSASANHWFLREPRLLDAG